MSNNYEEFIQNLNREAYHEGEYSWEEDEFTVYRSHPWSPPGCHNSCGVLLYVKDGVLDHVEGDPCSPFVNGKLCMRCLDLDEAVNHPDRIKYPMKRIGERGEGKWERITWDEAFDTVAEKAKYYIDTYGEQSLCVIRGTGRNVSWSATLLGFLGFQTPNQMMMFMVGYSCYMPRVMSSQAIWGDYWMADSSLGHEERYLHPEWQPPGVVIVWGNEPLKSNADGYIGHWLVECMQLGSKVISIDPRLTWWGARAEYFLQVRPGSDPALAMAMLHVITSENLYNAEFVEKWCYGFDQMVESVEESTPEWAAEICGIEAEDIRGAARLFATEGPGTIQWGLPFEQMAGCTGLNLSVLSLLSICGYVDIPGGALILRNAYGLPSTMSEGYLQPDKLLKRRMTPREDAPWGETRQTLWDFESHDPDRIRMGFIQSSNGIACPNPDAPRIYDIFKNLEFVAAADVFITPTISCCADIIMPVAMSPERDCIRTWFVPLRCVAKATQYYEAKTDEDIAIEIGRRLRPDAFPWKDAKDLQNWRLRGDDFYITGGAYAKDESSGESFSIKKTMHSLSVDTWDPEVDFDKLKVKGYSYDTFADTYYKYEKGMLRADGQTGFNTNTGRIELYSLSYQVWGMSPLPEHVEPNQGPYTTPELFEKYPLYMVSGVRSYEFFHSEHRQLNTMREFHPWPLVCMNQRTADKYGVRQGEWAWIENDQGRFKQIVEINAGVKDGVITTEHGWWFPEDDVESPTYCRAFDSNANNCTDAELSGPYGVSSPTKNMLVTMYPVKEGDVTPTEQVVERGGFPMQKARREAYEAEWKAKGIENN